jgi:hypothetical protein
MKSNRSARRVLVTVLSGMVTLGASWLAGCGPSGVGTTPSTKKEVSEFLSKQSEADQIKGGRPGKKFQGPKNIKSKIFAGKTEKTE